MSEIDIVTIGSATMDVFVESDEANIVSVCAKDRNADFMSYPYGSKIDMTSFATNIGGGGLNTAMNFANLGLKTSAIFKVGDDIYCRFDIAVPIPFGNLGYFSMAEQNIITCVRNKE
jgi:sugar/nucleoside kinase (ribokinase family)